MHHINSEHVMLVRILFYYEAGAVRCGSSRNLISSMVDFVWHVQFHSHVIITRDQCLWQQRKVNERWPFDK
jgi:hypothetical protein